MTTLEAKPLVDAVKVRIAYYENEISKLDDANPGSMGQYVNNMATNQYRFGIGELQWMLEAILEQTVL